MKQDYFHLALILDGNRRWAKEHSLPKAFGHRQGVENLRKLLPAFIKLGITHLTTYALSSENLEERSEGELKNLFSLIEKFAKDDAIFLKNEIKVNVLGNLKKFPTSTKKVLRDLVGKTKNNRKLVLNLALGYGGRSEIVEACNTFVKSGEKANEKTFEEALYTKQQPSIDLLIRPGGKKRLSNFLLWQLAYAELYFCEKLWPEFDERELKKALKWFEKQKRNFGK